MFKKSLVKCNTTIIIVSSNNPITDDSGLKKKGKKNKLLHIGNFNNYLMVTETIYNHILDMKYKYKIIN